jgi:hypothetical protein
MATLLELCNRALGQIAAGAIASFDEGSLEARECERFAQPLLDELADWTEWRWLVKRVGLAIVTNDRPAEWLYAYAQPTDMAQPLAIREPEEDAQGLPTFGPYAFPMQDSFPLAFLNEGGVIYTNVEAAVLVYTRNSVTPADLPPLVQRAFELELGARIALPIKKDSKVAQYLSQQAEVARQRAVSDEENKRQSFERRYVSQAEYARAGVGNYVP